MPGSTTNANGSGERKLETAGEVRQRARRVQTTDGVQIECLQQQHDGVLAVDFERGQRGCG